MGLVMARFYGVTFPRLSISIRAYPHVSQVQISGMDGDPEIIVFACD